MYLKQVARAAEGLARTREKVVKHDKRLKVA